MSSLYSVCVPQSVQFGVDISTSASTSICIDAKFAILKVQCHLRKRWFRVDETPILEVGRGAPCRPVAFFRAFCFDSKRFLR